MPQAGQQNGTGVSPDDLFESLMELMCLVDQNFFAESCRWLGQYFGAVEVSLFSSTVCRSDTTTSQPWMPEAEVARWHEQSQGSIAAPENDSAEPLPIPRDPCHAEDCHAAYRIIGPRKHLEYLKVHNNWAGVPELEHLVTRTVAELERHQEHHGLAAELQTLKTVVSCFPGLVLAKDLDRRYFLINDAICELNQTDRENILGKRFEEIPSLGPSEVTHLSDQLAFDGQFVQYEVDLVVHGIPRYFRLQKSPIRDLTGRVVGLCGVAIEISDLIASEKKMQQANSFQAAVIETSAEGICVVSFHPQRERWEISLWNRKLAELSGYTAEEVSSLEGLLQLIRQEDQQRMQQRITRLVAGVPLQQEIWQVYNLKQQLLTLQISTAEVVDVHGKPAYAVFVNDITASQQIQFSLQESRQRQLLATKHARMSVWQWDLKSNQVSFDDNLPLLLGYDSGRIYPQKFWTNTVHPDDQARVHQHFQDFAQQKSSELSLQMRMQHADGRWLWMACQGQFLHDDPNTGIVIGIDSDVTDRVMANEEISQLQQELMQVSRLTSIGELSAGLAHEITQPVTAMRSYAAAIRKMLETPVQDRDESEILEYLSRVEVNARDASEILQTIRSLFTPSNMTMAPHSVGTLINQTLVIIGPELRKRQIQLIRNSSADSCLVEVNQSLMVHVLINLISNAMQAIESARPVDPAITIQTERDSEQVCISISDNGPGFAETVVESLFKPFVTTKLDGMGIGLAICKRIVEAHGGRIQGESQSGQGALFTIHLP